MKMSAKKVLGLVLAGVLAAGSLTACGGGGTAATTADTKAEATTAASDAKAESDAAADTTAADSGEKKTLRVAMECAYAPYNWTQPDDSNGAVAIADSNEFAYGYDVMMAKKICEELGYDLEIVRLDWDSLIPAVTTGKVDCVIAGQSITSERLQAVDFTEPYYYATIVTLVKEGSKYADAKSVADLAGATCTSQQSTIWYNTCLPQITGKGALIAYPNFKMIEFGGGDADFQVTDEDINIGISLKKGNTELKDAINSVLTKMTKDDFSKMMDEAISVQPLAN